MAGLDPKSAFADFGLPDAEPGQARVPATQTSAGRASGRAGSPGQARGWGREGV